ncbi:MAG: hypothetical protein V1835_03665 [Candidatus Micrarchaeota archaeon]
MNKRKGQSAIEYVMIVGGAIMFVVLVVLILRSGVISHAINDLENKTGDFETKYIKNYLFYDDFDSPSATKNKWINLTGWWIVDKGVYNISAPSGGYKITNARGRFGNFTIETRLRRTSGLSVGFGIRIRTNSSAPNNGYILLVNTANTLFLGGVINQNLPGLDLTQWHYLKLKAEGNTFDLYIDGAHYGPFSDTDNTWMSGNIGLVIAPQDGAEFDYFRVWQD